MDERTYLRTLAGKLMWYVSPKKLENMLGVLAFVLSMALLYSTVYVSTTWILLAALLLLLLSLWLLAGGNGMSLLFNLTQAHPDGLLPYSIPFLAALIPIVVCLLCFHYPIGLFGLLPPEQFGNACVMILRICILAMIGQVIWFFLKTRRMGGGYFLLVIQAVGSAFCSFSLLRYLTRMDLPEGGQMLLTRIVVIALLYYLGGLLLSFLLFFLTHRGTNCSFHYTGIK